MQYDFGVFRPGAGGITSGVSGIIVDPNDTDVEIYIFAETDAKSINALIKDLEITLGSNTRMKSRHFESKSIHSGASKKRISGRI